MPLDTAGDPYTFGFQLGSLVNDEGEVVYDCECCPTGRAFYRAADDTFWCVLCWRLRRLMNHHHQKLTRRPTK